MRDFVETYPDARYAAKMLRDIVVACMSSSVAGVWDEEERGDKMFLFAQLTEIIELMYDAVEGGAPAEEDEGAAVYRWHAFGGGPEDDGYPEPSAERRGRVEECAAAYG